MKLVPPRKHLDSPYHLANLPRKSWSVEFTCNANPARRAACYPCPQRIRYTRNSKGVQQQDPHSTLPECRMVTTSHDHLNAPLITLPPTSTFSAPITGHTPTATRETIPFPVYHTRATTYMDHRHVPIYTLPNLSLVLISTCREKAIGFELFLKNGHRIHTYTWAHKPSRIRSPNALEASKGRISALEVTYSQPQSSALAIRDTKLRKKLSR